MPAGPGAHEQAVTRALQPTCAASEVYDDWPTLLLVDRRGVVRYHHIGEGASPEIEAIIRRLLAEEA